MTLGPLASHITRLLFPLDSVRRVWRGPLRGMKYIVQPGMGAAFAFGIDAYNQGYFVSRVRPGMNIYDVGANCGQMALLFARLAGPGGRVVTMEPVPRNFRLLKRNLELNAVANVTPRKMAAGRAPGTVRFRYDEASHMEGGMADHPGACSHCEGIIEVQCNTLDNVLVETGVAPDFLKLDVEGGGGEVIAGAQELLSRHRPLLYFELHTATRMCPEHLAALELRDRFGYELQTLEGEVISDLEPGWGRPIWCVQPSP